MNLIYVSDRRRAPRYATGARDQEAPEHDIEPLLLALLHRARDFVLRDAGAAGGRIKPKGATAGVARYSVEVGQARRCLREAQRRCSTQLRRLIADGEVQVAVALATIYFDRGCGHPAEVDYIEHIVERSRLADKLVAVGYTDPACTPAASEDLAYRRALAVRRTLRHDVDLPVVAIARPLCRYAETDEESRRVEVASLYEATAGAERLGLDSASYGIKDEDDDGSFGCEARVAFAH
ncbi:MAG: hypothetical protein ISN26_02975 [Betaproteobacteria bacterium AqS2]|uniref:OmpA family protein n=1 Tax=Candidatus Amphirhobacter heronislandensis TaxID=1732024 RepID=A0A930XXP2_9GAMM|nr:hypothetical protein [Betaproteobacteria bacterium AqS2]